MTIDCVYCGTVTRRERGDPCPNCGAPFTVERHHYPELASYLSYINARFPLLSSPEVDRSPLPVERFHLFTRS